MLRGQKCHCKCLGPHSLILHTSRQRLDFPHCWLRGFIIYQLRSVSGLNYSNIWRDEHVRYSCPNILDQDWQVWLNFLCIWLIYKPLLSFKVHCIFHLLVPWSFINAAVAVSSSSHKEYCKAIFFNSNVKYLHLYLCKFRLFWSAACP